MRYQSLFATLRLIGVFVEKYIKNYPLIGSVPVVLKFSPNAIKKLSLNALQYSHNIPKFESLNTRSLSWISESFDNFDAAQSACDTMVNNLIDIQRDLLLNFLQPVANPSRQGYSGDDD